MPWKMSIMEFSFDKARKRKKRKRAIKRTLTFFLKNFLFLQNIYYAHKQIIPSSDLLPIS